MWGRFLSETGTVTNKLYSSFTKEKKPYQIIIFSGLKDSECQGDPFTNNLLMAYIWWFKLITWVRPWCNSFDHWKDSVHIDTIIKKVLNIFLHTILILPIIHLFLCKILGVASKILHNHCFGIFLGVTLMPREIYASLFFQQGGGGGGGLEGVTRRIMWKC